MTFCKNKLFSRFLYFSLFMILFLPLSLIAKPIQWEILPNESSVSFMGTQNDSPISGKFTKFSGEIQFDPEVLNNNLVKIKIDTNSISFSYKDIEDTLKSADWLHVKLFPEATFEAHDFVKIGEDHYQAKGFLTIRDKKLPVNVEFTKESEANNKVKVKGTSTIKRTQFEVGKGEWGSTDEVKDEVKVNFVLTVVKKG